MSNRFQRLRSWSRSVISSPSRLVLAGDPRRLDLHQRDQPVHFGLVGRERGEHAAEAHRLLAQLRPRPGIARGRRVAFIEGQVHDLENGCEPRREFRADRHLERHFGVRQGLLRAGDARGHRRCRDEERARGLFGRQAADQLQRESHARHVTARDGRR
jgi:hypothetical protein